jgi:hypothetical protein
VNAGNCSYFFCMTIRVAFKLMHIGLRSRY